MTLAVAVTGTDTGVGKTVVASTIAATFRARGARVGVFKPVETGVPAGTEPADSRLLKLASGCEDPLDVICPYALPDACLLYTSPSPRD